MERQIDRTHQVLLQINQKLEELASKIQVKEYYEIAELQQIASTTAGATIEFSEPVKAFYVISSAAVTMFLDKRAGGLTTTFLHGGIDLPSSTLMIFAFPVKLLTFAAAAAANVTVIGLR